jgi:hypothetical protein
MKPARASGSALVLAAVIAAAAAGLAAGWASAASPATTQAMPVAPAAKSQMPSALIFPAETVPLRFDHAQHARLGATCEGCHVSAQSSASAVDNLIPAEAACRSCHKIDRAQPAKTVGKGQGAARCDACHVDPTTRAGWMPPTPQAQPPRVTLSRPNLKFNHRLHAGRGYACALCHTTADTQAMVTRADLPMMASCLGCHDGRQATGRCTACHLAEADGRIKVRLASPATVAAGGSGPLMPSGSLKGLDAHGPTFRRDHAQVGRDEGYCLSCHRRNECVDCHGGVVRPPDIHPADYVSLHAMDARRNVPDCSSCHRAQTFCVGCHQRSGVSADAEGGRRGRQPQNPFGTGTGLKQFHPPSWARDPAGEVISAPRPTSHSMQAKRNLKSCVSCHREDSCLTCHSTDPTRGPVFSPHGPGFGATARCRLLSSRNQRVCLKCHALGSSEIDCQ